MSVSYQFIRLLSLVSMMISGPGLGFLAWLIMGATGWVESETVRCMIALFVLLFVNLFAVGAGLISYQLDQIIRMNVEDASG